MHYAFFGAASLTWAIEETYLRFMLTLALREPPPAEMTDQLQAIALRRSERLNQSPTVTRRGGVATVPVFGPIFQRANLFTELSHATSTEAVGRDVGEALDDPSIHAIVLRIDSPGGEALGIAELAKHIVAARERKRIVAYVEGLGTSAAYWLASAASRVVVDDLAHLGSVGAVLRVRDPRVTKSEHIEFVSSQSPRKRLDPTTDEGAGELQAVVDKIASIFIESVAAHRDVSVDKVLADFGRGGVLIGRDAVAAGLADALGTYEGVLADLAQQRVTTIMGGAVMSDQPKVTQEGPDITALQEQLAAMQAQQEQDRAERAAERRRWAEEAAKSFYGEQVTAGRVFPAQKAALTDLYLQLAQDDFAHPVDVKLPDGTTGTRTAAFRAYVESQPDHGLFADAMPVDSATGQAVTPDGVRLLPNQVRTSTAPGAPMTPQRRAALLGKTARGRAILEAEAK